MAFSKLLLDLKEEILAEIAPLFKDIDAVAEANTLKVLDAMREAKLGEPHFNTTAGYAYGDIGREKADEIFARVFGAEKALVRTQFVSGTHALAAVLFGILRPGDELLSLAGTPYDTMKTVIGTSGNTPGSLKDFKIDYRELPLAADGHIDFDNIADAISPQTKVCLLQRSRGYQFRPTLSLADIEKAASIVHAKRPGIAVFVDNCYGEFTDLKEPTEVGADIIAGSLIKNPGGGLALTGGYIAGKSELVDLAAGRLTAPGLADELGASLANNRHIFQGLFLAPHVTAQAIKGAIFTAALFDKLGYKVSPRFDERRGDIIQAVELGSKEKLIAFCGGIQKYSPVDSFAAPEPWDMPGYEDQVVMAAGTFVQGASIELSADGPIRPPYNVFLQGGLTFEHAVIGALGAAAAVMKTSR